MRNVVLIVDAETDEVLGHVDAHSPDLALEPRRQPELGEQLRVDEVVQPGDPPV